MNKPFWPALLVMLLLPSLAPAQPFEAIEPPATLTFSLPTSDGEQRSLADFHGRVVIINFWASWCTPCVREMPELMQIKKQYAEQPLEIIAINVGESPAHAKQFVASMGFDLPVLIDRDRNIFKHWGGRVLPMSLLIDAQGQARFRAIGDPGWFDLPTQQVIDGLLAVD